MIYQRNQKRLAQGKKCTATDARYFQTAENLLYMELGVALGKPKQEICKTIIKRQGTNKISCLIAALTILMMPFPRPEAKYPHRIVIAAITKETEMIRSAGIPRVSISWLAENNCNNCPEKHQNMTVPHKAIIAPVGSKTFHVCCTR